MKPTSILDDLAEGHVTLRDAVSLTPESLARVAALGRAAFEGGRYEQAIQIFSGLEALEADQPAHSLRRALCEVRAGMQDEALESLERFFLNESFKEPEDVVEGLLLRAGVLRTREPDRARDDLELAKKLSVRFSGGEAAR